MIGNFEKDFRLFAGDHGVSSSVLSDYSKMMNSSYIEPTIMEERQRNVAQLSVFSRLFMDRILWLGTGIDDYVANVLSAQLLYLDMDNPEKPIKLYLNTPGGSVYDGLAIYDTMNLIHCPVETTCIGTAASMGAVLLAAGEKGKRSALPNSQIMLHAPSGGTGRVTAPDMKIAAQEMLKCEKKLYTILSENMGKDYDYIAKICDRDHWLTPEEAIAEGVIDNIITGKK